MMRNYLNIRAILIVSCFLWFKDTKMKANHNPFVIAPTTAVAVSYGSKILK